MNTAIFNTSKYKDIGLSFFWWNINLAPLGSEKTLSEAQINEKAAHIIDLLLAQDIGVLCLGEVGTKFIAAIESLLIDKDYKIFNGVSSVKQVKFDTCAIYDTKKLTLVSSEIVVLPHVDASQKIAHKLFFKMNEADDLFYLYLLHWPSRIKYGANDDYRVSLGTNLYTSISNLFHKHGDDLSVVVLGDFNDEPYNRSMTSFLCSSRDRNLVRKRPRFLYNPFWQFLKNPVRYIPHEDTQLPFGTYEYASTTDLTESHIFDQMLFSSSYINNGPWHLAEDTVQIIDKRHTLMGKYLDLIDSDHSPIYAEIKRYV
jgi:hypothetical protein